MQAPATEGRAGLVRLSPAHRAGQCGNAGTQDRPEPHGKRSGVEGERRGRKVEVEGSRGEGRNGEGMGWDGRGWEGGAEVDGTHSSSSNGGVSPCSSRIAVSYLNQTVLVSETVRPAVNDITSAVRFQIERRYRHNQWRITSRRSYTRTHITAKSMTAGRRGKSCRRGRKGRGGTRYFWDRTMQRGHIVVWACGVAAARRTSSQTRGACDPTIQLAELPRRPSAAI